MSESAEHYKRLLKALLREREAAGGTLPVSVESRYVEKLDHLWWSLSPSEQDAISREVAPPLEWMRFGA